ncbi:MAG TPA: response regulator [Chitinophagales bacterium]|nr:response regulator [Chitinophagales bacterium]
MKRLPYILTTLLPDKAKRVMLADDDAEDREIFLDVMQEVMPFAQVFTAENGEDLMAKLNDEQYELPELIFLDLNMPLKNGHECLQEIRKSERFRDIPVIIYSTSVNNEYIDETFKKGANFYFPKPSSFKNLRIVMNRIFELDTNAFKNPKKENYVLTAEEY